MSATRFGSIVPFLVVPESELQDKHRKKAKKDAHNSFSFLFLTDFFPFFSAKRKTRHKDAMFLWRKDVKKQSVEELQKAAAKGHKKEKRELARRLMEGDGVDKDEAKAVSLLEDCVAREDTDSMVMLARWCALGSGMEHNAERAEALLSDAAEKGNDEARILLRLINDCKGKESIDLKGLRMCVLEEHKKETHICVAERVKGKWTIERVALVMNIVPCRDINLECKTR